MCNYKAMKRCACLHVILMARWQKDESQQASAFQPYMNVYVYFHCFVK